MVLGARPDVRFALKRAGLRTPAVRYLRDLDALRRAGDSSSG
jgi:hypothetical protein